MQNNQEKYEINKICRCCLKNTGQMNPLYGFSLDEMLRSVTDLQVERKDGLPELLCFQCVLQLSRAFRFKEQCRKSDATVRDYLATTGENHTFIATGEEFKISEIKLEHSFNATYDTDSNGDNREVCEDDRDSSCSVQEVDNIITAEPNNEIHAICSNFEFKCETCQKQFSSRKQLIRHIKIHEVNNHFKCLECDKTFVEKSNLKKHLHKHTGELKNTEKKSHICPVCGNSFKYSSSLSKHMKFHTGKNLFHCPHCPKYYAEKSALNIHLRCHTGDRPHVCHQCDRRFTQASNLQKHLRSHSGERPFQCPVCERTFVQRDYIPIHMQTHCLEKRALCSVCGKQFANAKTLDAHMRVHSEERSYSCGFENCNKKFSRLDTARVHRRIHSGEKPYTCEVCNQSFTTSTQLSNHLRTHTGEKPFACEICLKKFASKSSLRSHSNKHTSKPITIKSEHLTNQDLKPLPLDEQIIFQQETVAEQMFEESVLLFKINQDGELVPETECSSIAKMTTVYE